MGVRAAAEGAPRRVALITGASRGIGAACARSLGAAGWDLMLTARSATDLQALARESSLHAVRAEWIAQDALDPAGADALVGTTVETFGRLDALLCCAGVLKVASLLNVRDLDIDESLALNLLAPWRQARAAARVMVPNGSGRMVFISSIFGQVSAPNYSLYTVAKAGLIGLVRSLAVELAPHGVQVNAIAPGLVRTEMIAPAIDRFGEQRLTSTTPIGRIGEAEEIARAVRFLIDEAPDFLTGDVMAVDGGYLCR